GFMHFDFIRLPTLVAFRLIIVTIAPKSDDTRIISIFIYMTKHVYSPPNVYIYFIIPNNRLNGYIFLYFCIPKSINECVTIISVITERKEDSKCYLNNYLIQIFWTINVKSALVYGHNGIPNLEVNPIDLSSYYRMDH